MAVGGSEPQGVLEAPSTVSMFVVAAAAEELVSSSLCLSLRIPATVAAPLSVESQGPQLEQVAIRPVGA